MWTFIPTASCRCVPESRCSTSDLQQDFSPLASLPGLSATVSGTALLKPFSWRGWKTRAWSQPLFATILAISTNGGADALIGSWLDFLASLGPSPEDNKASETKGGSGRLSFGSFGTFDPDSCSWKMSQGLLWEEDSTSYSVRLPKSGSMRSGAISRQPALAQAIAASEFSSWPTVRACSGERSSGANRTEFYDAWPTPTAFDDNKAPEAHIAMKTRMGGNRTAITSLNVLSQCWPSPRSEAGESCGNHPGATDSLTGAITTWATPDATAGKRGNTGYSEKQLNRKEGTPSILNYDVLKWTSPFATDQANRGNRKRKNGHAGGGESNLADDVQQCPSPQARDHKSGAASEETASKNSRPLNEAVLSSLPDQTPTGSKSRNGSGRRLNPAFVCWLMGWPAWWTRTGLTSCDALETEWFHWQQQLQRALCLLGSSNGSLALNDLRVR